MSQGSRPYQGYLSADQVVTDAPSLTPAAASRWANLPKTQVHTVRKKAVNVDEQRETNNPPPQTWSPQQTRPESLDQVVYIDLPEANQDSPSPSRNTEEGPQFIQETIFYDPFKDRRIELSRDNSISPTREVTEEDEVTCGPSRPNRPANLDLQSHAGTSGLSPDAVPPFMNKEANIYRRPTPDDGFNLTPIPVAEFPDPPPAYSEFDNARPVVEQPRPSMPRTQVTISPEALPLSADRKYVNCPHCRVKVYTLVVRQTGMMTHVVACVSFMVCLWPVTIAVYCMECSKYKNHYCPSCNNLIGYEIPMCCQSMVYVKQ